MLINEGRLDIIPNSWIKFMSEIIEMNSNSKNEFWSNATKYSSWSKGEYEFLKEMSFILVTIRNTE